MGEYLKRKMWSLLAKPLFWAIAGGVLFLLLIMVLVTSAGALEGDISNKNKYNESNGDFYGSTPADWWWPIGSEETTTENGKLFASGDPASVYISENYGNIEWRRKVS